MYKLLATSTEASVAVVEATMGVVEASTEVVDVVGGFTQVLRASTAFSVLPGNRVVTSKVVGFSFDL